MPGDFSISFTALIGTGTAAAFAALARTGSRSARGFGGSRRRFAAARGTTRRTTGGFAAKLCQGALEALLLLVELGQALLNELARLVQYI